MKNLLTIRDADLGLDYPVPSKYTERRASRAILFDNDKNIALLFVSKFNNHKLPGGGIEGEETILQGLNRELLEETGCRAKNVKEMGEVEEFRNKYAIHQISYCFLADLDGEKGTPHFEADEIEDGFKVVWVKLEEAIKMQENELDAVTYEGKFYCRRELAFLKEAAAVLKS